MQPLKRYSIQNDHLRKSRKIAKKKIARAVFFVYPKPLSKLFQKNIQGKSEKKIKSKALQIICIFDLSFLFIMLAKLSEINFEKIPTNESEIIKLEIK